MKIYSLVKRNFLIFIRDRGAVFFSLLSMLIIIVLMAVFLGSMNVDELTALLKQYGSGRNVKQDQENARCLVLLWTVAGILVVNSVTVSLAVLGAMVSDEQEKRLMSFYTAPVRRMEIALGYILTSIIVSVLMCILTLALAQCYVLSQGGTLPDAAAQLKAIGLIVLDSAAASAVMYLAALFVKSSSAWSAIGTVTGTLVGFVGAIYLPVGMLPESVAAVLKGLPVLHAAALMRELFTYKAIETTFQGLDQAVAEGYREAMGISIQWNGSQVSPLVSVCFLIGCAIIALGAAAVVMRNKRAK